MDYDNGFTEIINLIDYVEKTSVPYQQKINSTIYKIKSFQSDLKTDKATFQLNIEELNELEVTTKQQKEQELKEFDDLRKELNELSAQSNEQQEKVRGALNKLGEAQRKAQASSTAKNVGNVLSEGFGKLGGTISKFVGNEDGSADVVTGVFSALGQLSSLITTVVSEFNASNITQVVSQS